MKKYLITYYVDFTDWEQKEDIVEIDEDDYYNFVYGRMPIFEIELSNCSIIASNQVIEMKEIE